MLTLRKILLLVISWTSTLVLITMYFILTRNYHKEGVTVVRQAARHLSLLRNQEKRDVICKKLEFREKVTPERPIFIDKDPPLSVFDIPDFDFNINTTTTKTRQNDKRIFKKKEIDLELIFAEREKQKSLREENRKLKQEIKRIEKQLMNLLQKKNQLKQQLIRRLTAHGPSSYETSPKLDPSLPWVFAITPTFKRYTQKADLVRLSQTLQLVPNLHWIIVEDSQQRTDLVKNLLLDSGLSFTHLHVRTPVQLQRKKGEKYNKHHRGVPQRNLGLKWIRTNIKPEKTPGVVYFMDDDNTYHRKLFEEMRWTKKVSVWPVALTGAARWAGPIVSNGKVVDFHTNWANDRKFPIDMAAFAVNLKVLITDFPSAEFSEKTKRGYLEPTFLEAITTVEDLEPMAENCTKILVWHTRTEKPKDSIKGEKELIAAGKPSDPNIET